MNYTDRFAPAASRDLQRQFDFLAERDAKAARRARSAIAKGMEFLRTFPFSCRKASPEHPLLRELIIIFSANGYVVLFEIEDSQTVTGDCWPTGRAFSTCCLKLKTARR